MTLAERGRKGGLISGAVRRRQLRRWKTITFAVPPADYASLTVIVERDGTRYSTLAREAVQAYLCEMEEDSMHAKWAIRVTYPSGQEAWLRRGSRIGVGPIVYFGTKQLAELNVEFIREGLDDGTVVAVVRMLKSDRQ